jgi:hypothetical protein
MAFGARVNQKKGGFSTRPYVPFRLPGPYLKSAGTPALSAFSRSKSSLFLNS